jgi:hypothetical protein
MRVRLLLDNIRKLSDDSMTQREYEGFDFEASDREFRKTATIIVLVAVGIVAGLIFIRLQGL